MKHHRISHWPRLAVQTLRESAWIPTKAQGNPVDSGHASAHPFQPLFAQRSSQNLEPNHSPISHSKIVIIFYRLLLLGLGHALNQGIPVPHLPMPVGFRGLVRLLTSVGQWHPGCKHHPGNLPTGWERSDDSGLSILFMFRGGKPHVAGFDPHVAGSQAPR